MQTSALSIKKNEVSAITFEFAQKSYEVDTLKFQSKYELLYNNALIK